MFLVIDHIHNSWHGPFEDTIPDENVPYKGGWEKAWNEAKRITNGQSEGNVTVLDVCYYEPLAFSSEYAPGRKMSQKEWETADSYLRHFANQSIGKFPDWPDDDDDYDY